MNCDNCVHSGICMKEASARKYEESIMALDTPKGLSTNVKCDRFRMKFGSPIGDTIRKSIKTDKKGN